MSGRVEESVWEERREWIRKQEASGLSAAQFCRENGLHGRGFILGGIASLRRGPVAFRRWQAWKQKAEWLDQLIVVRYKFLCF